MKLAYISGPYRAGGEWEVWQNIQRASEVAVKYWKLGYAVICPHRNTAFFGGQCDDDTWLQGDIEILKRCDVIVMMRGWKMSIGACAELRVAKQRGLTVIYDSDNEAIDYYRRDCLECKGRGIITYNHRWGKGEMNEYNMTCLSCDGSAMQVLHKSIKLNGVLFDIELLRKFSVLPDKKIYIRKGEGKPSYITFAGGDDLIAPMGTDFPDGGEWK